MIIKVGKVVFCALIFSLIWKEQSFAKSDDLPNFDLKKCHQEMVKSEKELLYCMAYNLEECKKLTGSNGACSLDLYRLAVFCLVSEDESFR